MSVNTAPISVTRNVAPDSESALMDVVRQSHDDFTPVYPIGGGSSLDFGLPGRDPGIGLSVSGLNRIIDYPARDMTITVEAGITMSRLAETLAAEGQRLPIDVPLSAQATLGGVVATNCSGPRRYGLGTIRDYVIGIAAVDGRGMLFHGGGRVVKNVAGYDFCKLLTGSLGTLGVISHVTLKVRPAAEAAAFVFGGFATPADTEPVLAALVTSRVAPVAIELLAGPAWRDDPVLQAISPKAIWLAVGFEGTQAEVDWQTSKLLDEWRSLGVSGAQAIAGEHVSSLWSRLTEFPAAAAPLVLKVSVRPSAVAGFVAHVLAIDPECSVQAHAGNGIVIVRFAKFAAADVSRILIGKLQPIAANSGGHVVVLSSTLELTRQSVWGSGGVSARMMQSVKQQFDPRGILNPGRFVF